MLYKLAADLEIIKIQMIFIFNRYCTCCFPPLYHFRQKNLVNQSRCFKSFKRCLFESCAREIENDDDQSDASEMENENNDLSLRVLNEVREGMEELTKNNRGQSALPGKTQNKNNVAKTGSQGKRNTQTKK